MEPAKLRYRAIGVDEAMRLLIGDPVTCEGCGNADPGMLRPYVHRNRKGMRCARCIEITEAVAR